VKHFRFGSLDELIGRLNPSYPVFCVYPDVLAARARQFIDGFPGTVLYAVKCNAHPFVLRAIHDAGVRHFDTASLREIGQVIELFDDATCYFNHPVKGRGALDSANKVYGLRDYVVDHITELDKVNEVVGTDITVEVRLATPKSKAVFDLSSKFGANGQDAVALLREANRRGCRTALAFHVGSQCGDPTAFRQAIDIAAKAADTAGVPIEYLNVGGGFPAAYQEDVPPLDKYFETIMRAKTDLGIEVPLLCEPGRAMVADGCTLLVQVHLRKGDDLYINDGIYGCLSEVRDGDLDPPVRALGAKRSLQGTDKPFRIFGPTCDPTDVLKVTFDLPDDIGEGDWIEIMMLGAYSLSIASGFNGFITDTVVSIDGAPSVRNVAS